jgi:hypothetical protein
MESAIAGVTLNRRCRHKKATLDAVRAENLPFALTKDLTLVSLVWERAMRTQKQKKESDIIHAVVGTLRCALTSI